MKYKGNLIGACFNLALNTATPHSIRACTNCPHHNGECVAFARAGTCNRYNRNGRNLKDVIYSVENGKDVTMFATENAEEAKNYFSANSEAKELWIYWKEANECIGEVVGCYERKEEVERNELDK